MLDGYRIINKRNDNMYHRDEFGYLLLNKKDKLNYYDQQVVFIGNKATALVVYNEMTKNQPFWLRISFAIRDKISSLAGVKKINGFSGQRLKNILNEGDYIDFFQIIRISDDELCLEAKDIHLTVLISMNIVANTDQNTGGYNVIVTASVITHNFFGKIYMIPVSLTHGFIVRRSLARVRFL
jgi:hypothetical protein